MIVDLSPKNFFIGEIAIDSSKKFLSGTG